MKTLTNYIIEPKTNHYDIYVNIGEEFIKEALLDESISDTIKQTITKLKDKKDDLVSAAKSKMSSMSDACKKALVTVEKKAGKAWENIKDIYTSVITLIDCVLQNTKDQIKTYSSMLKLSIVDLEIKLATSYCKLLGTSGVICHKISDFILNLPETQKQLIALNSLIISIVLMGDGGLDLSFIGDIIDGFQRSKGDA